MSVLLHRRSLLAAGIATSASFGLGGMAFASAPMPDTPLLVLVNLRGGMDSLHMLSPADDRHFVNARPPELRTRAEGGAPGHRLDASRETDFRLHPRASGLARIWSEGRMAIWPAAGVPEPTRSHFEAQEMLGLGRGWRRDSGSNRGWLGAWAEQVDARQPEPALIPVMAAQDTLPAELRGCARALATANTTNSLRQPAGDFGQSMLEALYRQQPGAIAAAGRAALASLHGLDLRLPRGPGGETRPYQPPPGVLYGAAREFGRSLGVIAQVARAMPQLVAATIDMDGWDTHEAQTSRMQDRVSVLDAGLDALDRDLATLGRRSTILVASEFGRRLKSNRSNGTDHGRAGLVLAFGHGFAGQDGGLARHFGPWPGLQPEALEDGTDVRVVTDYREAFSRVIADLLPTAPPPFHQA